MDSSREARWGRRSVAVLVVAAVLSPAVRDHDSFPLSTYPMYALARGRTATFATVRGFDSSGVPRRLPIGVIARTDDPLIAESRVARAVDSGAAAILCAEVAARAPREITFIEVTTERHDVVARAGGHESLRERTVHARCRVVG